MRTLAKERSDLRSLSVVSGCAALGSSSFLRATAAAFFFTLYRVSVSPQHAHLFAGALAQPAPFAVRRRFSRFLSLGNCASFSHFHINILSLRLRYFLVRTWVIPSLSRSLYCWNAQIRELCSNRGLGTSAARLAAQPLAPDIVALALSSPHPGARPHPALSAFSWRTTRHQLYWLVRIESSS